MSVTTQVSVKAAVATRLQRASEIARANLNRGSAVERDAGVRQPVQLSWGSAMRR